MKVIYNKHLPPGKFTAINIFGIIFARNEYRDLSKYELNHERIHSYQMLELLGVFFYILYVTEWLIRLIQYKDRILAYRNISFEREAYANDKDLNYLSRRTLFSFVRYYRMKK